jgi:mono/diheme cytochrome c family protein
MRILLALCGSVTLAGCMAQAAEIQQDAEALEAPPSDQLQDAVPAVPPPETGEAPPGPPPMPKPLTMDMRPDATGGEALFIEHCASCHGPNGMGTGLLGRVREVALLEERENLTAQFVTVAARQGIGNMPAIPRGEVSDEQMQAISEYLAAGPHEVAR